MTAFRTLVLSLALLSSAHAGGTGEDLDALVTRLQERYAATEDFRATFRQEVEVSGLGEGMEARGTVRFKRPGKMRWEFEHPERQTIVADGSTLWIHQPEDLQVLRAPFQAAFESSVPVSFLLGVGSLTRDFTPSIESDDGDLVRLRLEPKAGDRLGTLVLVVARETGDIRGAQVKDPIGNVTRLEFDDLERNVGLDDDTFVFAIPDGVDVVEPPSAP